MIESAHQTQKRSKPITLTLVALLAFAIVRGAQTLLPLCLDALDRWAFVVGTAAACLGRPAWICCAGY
ncbi:MAG: hypothetical protein IT307_19375 [Chloroflexi bacterium]|nr:hypothetical protein [Chloroflexota bacterium]